MTIALKSALVGALAVSCALAAAQTYDASDDYSSTLNENGVWSYGRKQTLLSPFELNSRQSTFFSFGTVWAGPDQRPVVGRLPSDIYDATAGTLFLHSGVPTQEALVAVLRFTAAFSGTYTVSGLFYAGDAGLTDNIIAYNNTTFLTADLAQSGQTTFSFSRTMNAGDTLDFMIAPGADANSDTTPLDVHIVAQPVPEPATMSIIGLAALGYVRRRRKASK